MNAITPIVALEAAPGVETPLWTGHPSWRSCALRVWKLGWVAAWFAVLLADGARLALAGTRAPPHAWSGELTLLTLAALTLGGLLALAALTARTTRYSIEARTVTLRYGIALSARLVIPFAAIEAVCARTHADGTGDVALRLKPGRGVIYPKLWPHARPWRLLRAEPMLRCIPDSATASALICRALAVRDPATGAPSR